MTALRYIVLLRGVTPTGKTEIPPTVEIDTSGEADNIIRKERAS